MLLLTLCMSPGASSSRIDVWHWRCRVTGYAHLHFSCMLSCCSCVRLCDPMDCSLSGSSVRGFSRQERWSGLPCPFLWDLSDPEIEPVSPASKTLKAHFFYPLGYLLGSTKLLSKILVSFVLSKYFWYSISLQALDFSKCLISCQTGGSK